MQAEAHFKKATSTAQGSQLTPAGKAAGQAVLPHLKMAAEIEKTATGKVPAGWYARGFQLAYVAGLPESPEWALLSVQSDPTTTKWRSLLRGYQGTPKALSTPEHHKLMRSAERLGGKACVRKVKSRWAPS